jgi:hypothetical protein
MQAFKNSDGSLDVLRGNQLFHVKSGRAKYVGQVTPSWRAWGREVRLTKSIINAVTNQ